MHVWQGVRTGLNKVRRAVTRTTTNLEPCWCQASAPPIHPWFASSVFFQHPSVRKPKPQGNDCSSPFWSQKWSFSINTGKICPGASFRFTNLNISTAHHRSGRGYSQVQGGSNDNYDRWPKKEGPTIDKIHRTTLRLSGSEAEPISQLHLSHLCT